MSKNMEASLKLEAKYRAEAVAACEKQTDDGFDEYLRAMGGLSGALEGRCDVVATNKAL